MQLSVITVNFNDANGLTKTIESVLKQRFNSIEYIIIDGGSTDRSTKVIEENAAKLSYWVSEKDKGIYHAMNKGIVKASGEYLLFLNSGDFFLKDTILTEIFSLQLKEDIIYGDVFYKTGEELRLKKYNSPLSFAYMYHDGLPHQACLIKRSLFEQIGLYDESLKISADWKFFMQAIFLCHATTKYIDTIFSVYDATGTSSIAANSALMLAERRAVLKQYFPGFIEDYQQLFLLRNSYNNLINSKYIKAALALKQLLPISIIKKILR